MPRIDAVDIDAHILDKIETKHGVTWREVEEVCFGRRQAQRHGREDTLLLYGRAHSGRYLMVALHDDEFGWKVLTARDMSDAERRWYQSVRR